VFGWWGVSAGTACGLPVCARQPRTAVAVLGMWGQDDPAGQPLANRERLARDAGQLRCPVLFQQKWDDQFYSRERQLAQFTQLGTADKWLKVYPGAHPPVAGEQLDECVRFIADRVGATGPRR
jgi:alpha-beta hydrolase superfamily lysophospholipase